jgi:hypothetical protein
MSEPTTSAVDLLDPERLERIAGHVRGLLVELGLDLADPNLAETPERVAKMYLEMFHGLQEGAEPKVTVFPNEERYSAMVMEKEHPVLLDVRPPPRAVLRPRPHRLHPERFDRRALEARRASSSSTPSGRSSRSG